MASDVKSDSEEKTEATADQQATTPAAQQRSQVELDDSKAVTSYANFCRVTGTPEELIVDFGLNSQPFGAPTEALEIRQRLVVTTPSGKY